MKKKLILIGGGGHCRSCIDVIESQGEYNIIGIVDVKEKLHKKTLGYEIIASDEDLPRLVKKNKYFFITIGQIKSYKRRSELSDFLIQNKVSRPRIISPYAYVSKYAQIGRGTIVHHNVMINSNVKIGVECIINTSSIIEHDCCIKDFCHISTGACINGGAIIGKGSFIGSNTSVREGIEIGSDVFIGMQKKIYKNIDNNSSIK